MCVKILYLIVVLVFAGVIIYLNKKRNAWDIMFFNTTFAIVVLFIIGILTDNHWKEIVYTLGLVAVGSGIAGIFSARKQN
ncbi:MAG TPA: hypothetical protein PLF15_03580 [bacterium]|nr:hypothetical protein [bacterium]